MLPPLLLAAACLVAPQEDAAPAREPLAQAAGTRTITFTARDFEDEAGVHALRLRHELPGAGTCYVRAWSDEVDLRLEVARAGGAPGEPASSRAGESWAFVAVESAEAATLELTLAAPRPAAGVLVVSAAIESAASREAAHAAGELVARARGAFGDGDRGEGRRLLEEATLAVLALEPDEITPAVVGSTRDLRPRLFSERLWEAALELTLLLASHYELHHPEGRLQREQEELALAQIHFALGEHAAAVEACTRALDALEAAGTPPVDALVLALRDQRGKAQKDLGRPRLALADWEANVEALAPGGAPPTAGYERAEWMKNMSNAAALLMDLRDFVPACALLERLVAELDRAPGLGKADELQVRGNYAIVLSAAGEHARALPLHEEVLRGLESLGLPADHPARRSAQLNLATSLNRLGRREEARAALEALVAGRDPAQDRSVWRPLQNLVDVHLASGELERARELQEQLLELRLAAFGPDHHEVVMSREVLARLLSELGDEGALHALLCDIAASGRRQVRSASARSTRQRTERIDQVDRALATLLVLADWSAAPEELRVTAFELSESARALTLLSARVPAAEELDGDLGQLHEAWREAGDALRRAAVAGEDLVRPVRRLDRVEAELRAALAERGWLPAPDVGAEGVRAALAPGECAVAWREVRLGSEDAFRVGTDDHPGDELVVWIVRPEAPLEMLELGRAREVERLAAQWRAAVGRPLASSAEAGSDAVLDANEAGARLRALVLDPILERVGGAQRLHVCLDGALHSIPLDALPARGGGRGVVVGDELELHVVSSLHWLLEPPAEQQTAPAFVGVGGVDYGPPGDRFRPLPGSLAQVERVEAQFVRALGGTTHKLCGGEVSAARLRPLAERATHLFVATHGTFFGELAPPWSAAPDAEAWELPGLLDERWLAPLAACGLALSGANGADGAAAILTAAELSTWDLSRCELAVLSACESNVGIARAGAELASLRAGLSAAGARTTLTTLWPVGSQWTELVLERFFAGMWNEGLPPHRALWEAKRFARDERAPLRDWAGWVLSGRP